ncbi:MAG: putative carboxylesterase [Pseudobdellovibrio sp.]|jgi:pimeloyl-ACP methyl ester carboxylesterase|nr:putative carboxylesterase [Pseudobdellovibrio sp.]
MTSYFFKSSRGYNYHYQVKEGLLPDTTVFLHGNIASNRWWLPTISEFTKRSEGKNLPGDMILIEMLGCGLSSPPSSPEDMDLIGFAADFNELIRNYCGQKHLKHVNLVGHSTGGFVAAAMTALDSPLFRKAVLLNPPGSEGIVLTGVIKAAYDSMRKDKTVLAQAIGSTIYKNDYNSNFFRDVILEDAHSAIQKISYWIVQAFHQINASELMKKSTVPTLVLFGEEDRMLSASAAEIMAVEHLQNAKFESVPGHGHSMNLENPAAFADRISGFLWS